MQFVSKWEWSDKEGGQYTNDPKDPGGETRYGISKRSYPNEDIKNLTLEHAVELYLREYWSVAVKFPRPINWCVMDAAINCGSGRATSWVIKDITYQEYNQRRVLYYLNLISKKPALQRFKQGWLNRVNDLNKWIEINDVS